MNWIVIAMIVILLLSAIGCVVIYKRELRIDNKIFEEYLQNRKRTDVKTRRSNLKRAKKNRINF